MSIKRRALMIALALSVLTGCTSAPESVPPAEPLQAEEKPVAKETTPSDPAPADLVEKRTADYEPFLQAVKTGNRRLVEESASQLLVANPADSVVLNGLAHFHRRSGRIRLAEILTRRALQNDPYDLRGLRNLAMIYWQRGEVGKALTEFHKIYQRDKAFPGVAENMAAIYFKAGVYSAVEEILADLQGQEAPLAVAAAYGQALVENGKAAESLTVFGQALENRGAAALLGSADGRAVIAGFLKVLELEPSRASGEEVRLQQIAAAGNPAFAARARQFLPKGGTDNAR